MADTTTQEYVQREPEWMEALRRALIGDVKDLAKNAPQNMPEYQVAGLSPEQINAIKMAKEGIGAYKPYIDKANELMTQAGTAKYDPNAVTEYMNPYQKEVTQNAIAEMNRQAAIQQQGVSAQAAKAGAFGGSRFGVQQAELGRNLADVQSSRIMQDYSQNYSQAQQAAMNAFNNQQARAYQSGTGLASLGQEASALNQGDASFQYNIGGNLQAQNQKLLDAQRMNQQMYNMEPYQRMSYYADILNKTPSGQIGYTQTTQPSASPFSQIAGLATAGLGAYRAYQSPWGGAQ
jgi:hypothetical protein